MVQMLAARVVFTQELLPVLVSLPLAWCQRDATSVPPSVCDGLWDFCCALGRPGRVAALSCMHGLLDSRPCEEGPAMAQWKELSDSVLTYMGRHATALCGLPRSTDSTQVPPLPSSALSITARVLSAGIVADASVRTTLLGSPVLCVTLSVCHVVHFSGPRKPASRRCNPWERTLQPRKKRCCCTSCTWNPEVDRAKEWCDSEIAQRRPGCGASVILDTTPNK